MGRTSDTRRRVRALAVVWTKEGRELSPTAVRKALGGGSATTIVQELKRFREELNAQNVADPGREEVVASLAGEPISADATVAEDESEPLPEEEAVEQPTPESELCASVDALTSELHKALARFDAMQKRMLRDVDEAREMARYWKDVAERTQADARAQVESYRAAVYKESERANILEGRLQQVTGAALTG